MKIEYKEVIEKWKTKNLDSIDFGKWWAEAGYPDFQATIKETEIEAIWNEQNERFYFRAGDETEPELHSDSIIEWVEDLIKNK